MKFFLGTTHFLNPLFFVTLSSRGDFVYQFMHAWAENNRKDSAEIIEKLRFELNGLDNPESLLGFEIRALISALKANVSNLDMDWKNAGKAFYSLSEKIAGECKGEGCSYTKTACRLAKESAAKFGYFSTSF